MGRAVGRASPVLRAEEDLYPDTRLNFTCRAYDMFQDNGNAARLVQALDVGEWIVFGNGFDLCVNSAVHGLLAAQQKVCLLSDVWVAGSRGYFVSTPGGQMECGTPENHARILAEFRAPRRSHGHPGGVPGIGFWSRCSPPPFPLAIFLSDLLLPPGIPRGG